uniref:Uncharacterized protein n=1 Tax=Rhizophora mucronata TaxID=61149 RepID=A0A2P2PT86_RHIMU
MGHYCAVSSYVRGHYQLVWLFNGCLLFVYDLRNG